MLEILAITCPIYLIVLAGYAATRGGLFARADMQVFGKFVFNLALPALIFNALAQRHIREILHPAYLLSYLFGSLLMLALAFFLGRRLLRLSLIRSTFMAMGVSCSNSSFIGFPILMLMVAPVAGVALGLNVIVENLVMLPLLLAMAEHGRGGGGGAWHQVIRQSAQRLMRNPLVISVTAGLIVSLSELKLPQPVIRTVTLFAQASGGLSLFAIGGMLVGLSLSTGWQRVVPLVAGKLIGHPLAVLLIASLVPLLGITPMAPDLRAAALLMAAMPMLSIYPILGQAYGEADRSATALLICMVASFFTLSAWMWLVHPA
ncbi:AEC family transporter [Pseudoduganella sp. FT25W]|uniref:AEC family transporter n=1 Tax=Duganella alba TaxID=2666081 RepID=A0A6L5QK55_9BURK|nr:AEC family transporter [Duganella alba]MRX10163.1 AEC family transporter [Duganella alba]MRX16649.1 AEC family transporter [Duganella alba]